MRNRIVRKQQAIFIMIILTGMALVIIGIIIDDSKYFVEGIAFLIVGSVGIVMSWTTFDVATGIKEAVYENGIQTQQAIKDNGVQIQKAITDNGTQIQKAITDNGTQMQKAIKEAVHENGIQMQKVIADNGTQIQKAITDNGTQMQKSIDTMSSNIEKNNEAIYEIIKILQKKA